MLTALTGDKTEDIPTPAVKTSRVETTLSFAIKPAARAVTIRQSLRSIGAKTGAIKPARMLNMLSFEFETILNLKSKVCKNQTIREAKKITVNARLKKSFAFSHKSIKTFLASGRR